MSTDLKGAREYYFYYKVKAILPEKREIFFGTYLNVFHPTEEEFQQYKEKWFLGFRHSLKAIYNVENAQDIEINILEEGETDNYDRIPFEKLREL